MTSQTKITAEDRIAIENAAIVLAAIAARADEHPDFAAHLHNLRVPGGEPIRKFMGEIGLTASRFPTPWKLADRRDADDAA